MAKPIRALANDSHSKFNYNKITDKQWSVYYYLLSISNWNEERKEDHRYVYKDKLNISAASRTLGIGRDTIYRALRCLEEYSLIYTMDYQYYIPTPEVYAEVNLKTVQFLLKFRKFIGIDLLRTYLILRKYYSLCKKDGKIKYFVKKEIIDLLGHSTSDTSFYHLVEIYLSLLEKWGLVELKRATITSSTGGYIRFSLIKAHECSSSLELHSFDEKSELLAVGMDEVDFQIIKKAARL